MVCNHYSGSGGHEPLAFRRTHWARRALVSSVLIPLLDAGKLFTSMSSGQGSWISCRSAEVLRMLVHHVPGDLGQSLKVGTFLGNIKPHQHFNCQL